MNKTKLIEVMAVRMNTRQKDVRYFIETFQAIIQEEMSKEEGTIMLQGFGSFNIWHQAARLGRNPKNGLPYMIPSRKSIKFKPSKYLLNGLNAGDH